MSEKKYIVTKEQIIEAVRWGLKHYLINTTVINIMLAGIDNEVETVLEDDCDEYTEKGD